MEFLLAALRAMPEYEALRTAVNEGQTACASGLAQVHRAHFLAALHRDTGRPVVAVCADEQAAQRMAEDLAALLGQPVPVLPNRELTLLDLDSASHGWEQQRLTLLWRLMRGELPALAAPVEALALRTIPKATLAAAVISLRAGGSYNLDDLAARLIAAGYRRSDMVEGAGQFALRGGILDIYSPGAAQPVRAEFFGDELDAMGSFDPSSQRRTENLEEAYLLPVAEVLPQLHPGGIEGLSADFTALANRMRRRKNPHLELLATMQKDLQRMQEGLPFAAADRYLRLIYPGAGCAAEYIPAEALVALCDHGAVARQLAAAEEQRGLELDGLLQSGMLAGELADFSADWDELCGNIQGHPCVYLNSYLSAKFPQALPPQQLLSVTARQLPSYSGSLDTAAEDLNHYQSADYRAVVLVGSRKRAELMQQMLGEHGVGAMLSFPEGQLPNPGQTFLCAGTLSGGMEYPTLKLAVLTEGQIAPQKETQKRRREKTPATNRQKLSSFTDLTPGDLVVHDYHGIGRYVGMEQVKVDGVTKDYVKLAYAGSDVLYVPATQLDLISKYIGGGEDTPVKVNKLGGDAWQKTKARAKAAAKDMAAGLVRLYAERRRRPGYAFAPDSPWQQEFEQSFPYAETDDQLRCIDEIKHDMESTTPMDRLLCGDVGFGKTEVALRAAMKAVLDGKQVAVLVPTTVLAQQHYATARSRFSGFPVNVEMLSRFRSAAEQKRTLAALEAGSVDVVIGTHKLLGKNVRFKDLGLLIVDEEQRFGVSHKERLKELSAGVDVLTLSATPIPRTLNMALSGIRDMSTIETPPGDRYPVQTFVLEHDDGLILEAVRRELLRGGQVYYLHNRVESIDQCAARLRRRLSETGTEATVAVAHGKMSEEMLSDAMQRMADGEVQVLVCTTLIETGIDIPNVNTLIIEDADKLGLAQLHQIRGRVGRSSRHAYAYLTFRRGKVLSEVADKRLSAVREFAEFGSGFKIAMRDLEIRGAGNLLGAEQSGHMLSVGYDMYLKLLEEAVLEERGEPEAARRECTADLTIQANIPQDYVGSGEQRMDLYRRMAAVRGREDADDLLDEIVDRFGDPPKSVMNLIDVALLRAAAAAVGVREITQREGRVSFALYELPLPAIGAICGEPAFRGRVFFSAGQEPLLTLRLQKNEDPLRATREFIARFGDCVRETQQTQS